MNAMLEVMSAKAASVEETESLDVMGTVVRPLVTASETGGQFSLFQMEAAPGLGVPMHVHEGDDETFIVTRGMVEVVVGILKAGSTAFGPRRIPHSWKVVGEERAEIYLLATPGGIEGMFDQLSKLAGPPDMAIITGVCRRFGIEFFV